MNLPGTQPWSRGSEGNSKDVCTIHTWRIWGLSSRKLKKLETRRERYEVGCVRYLCGY